MDAGAEPREPLSRARILQVALDYVDKHGLEALSMHKLGAELGVKGMSLYRHIQGKDGLLDGLVEAMWAEVVLPEETADTWQAEVRAFAQSLREMVHRHPEAARLLTNRPIMPTQALEYFEAFAGRLWASGISHTRALQLIRTLISYALGFAYFELTWADNGDNQRSTEPDDGLRAFQHVSRMVPAGTSEHLLRFALQLCTGCDMDAQFSDSVNIVLSGMESGDGQRD
ncbi:TetR/AcrR family transcriptional regulator [Amycolatopsis aidingensis]|uniref:TetR/AcrR family transcriptional regulator n=1 Tax=Amycolatopsis aidingensis TaxID=2842453 RepID=UPI001C0AE9A8|nr:TetR/AcrR family transcriptional regulator C-terminal domain-containing protein [Amycolatopsis aidingensis]